MAALYAQAQVEPGGFYLQALRAALSTGLHVAQVHVVGMGTAAGRLLLQVHGLGSIKPVGVRGHSRVE